MELAEGTSWGKLSIAGETSVGGSELLPLCRLVFTILGFDGEVSVSVSARDAAI